MQPIRPAHGIVRGNTVERHSSRSAPHLRRCFQECEHPRVRRFSLFLPNTMPCVAYLRFMFYSSKLVACGVRCKDISSDSRESTKVCHIPILRILRNITARSPESH